MLQAFLSSLKDEAKVRKNYLHNETVETIYFGGGTPSVLSSLELTDLLDFLKSEFKVNSDAEITLEANPDDLTDSYLFKIYQAGVNRLSVGIQSFQDKHLKTMNRRHNAEQAIVAIENASKAGFGNISADLIYGLPGLSLDEWEESLKQVFQLPVQHLSAYHLTYHQGTPFYSWLKKGTIKELKENDSIEQFNTLIDFSEAHGFEHYEISNLAKNGLYSRHNTSYWTGQKYLGLGPSAHSFDGNSRRWNISNIEQYIKAVERQIICFEEEELSEKDKFNEYILTRIRTKWGVSLSFVIQNFGYRLEKHLKEQLNKYKNTETIILKGDNITLSRKGLFISDDIMADLIVI